MVDIHCHILPGIDDGAKSWETTAEMCRMAAADGITHIVASPHANDEYRYDRAAYDAMLTQLRETASGSLNFSLGCDFHLSIANIRAVFRTPEMFLISGTDYLLVELSDFSIPPAIVQTLQRLSRKGIIPIITHPERNAILQQRPEMVLRFVAMGCVVQVTANSLTGFWGERPREAALYLLEHQAVHVIASDAHDLRNRPPVLSTARDFVSREFGPEVAQALVEANPGAIVRGQRLPYYPAPLKPTH